MLTQTIRPHLSHRGLLRRGKFSKAPDSNVIGKVVSRYRSAEFPTTPIYPKVLRAVHSSGRVGWGLGPPSAHHWPAVVNSSGYSPNSAPLPRPCASCTRLYFTRRHSDSFSRSPDTSRASLYFRGMSNAIDCNGLR